ncbi:MAG: hypothetical protein RR911_02430 [Oscillospiraceae bacterium]
MKKIILSIFMSIILVVITVSSASATNKEYAIDEMDITIDIPEEYATLTRNVEDLDPSIELFGFKNASEVEKMLKSYDAYLNTSPKTGGFGVLVTMTSNENSKDFFDLNYLSKRELKKLAEKAMKNNSGNVKYSNYEIYKHDQAKFIVFKSVLKDEKATSYVTQYYTVYNGQTININLYSYNEPASKEAITAQKNIVNSIKFTKSLKKPFSLLSPTGYTQIDTAIIIAVILVAFGTIYFVSKYKKQRSSYKK